MIRINLLPEEYRRKSRTPLKLMVGLSAAVAVNSALLAYLGWLSLGVAREIDSQRQVLQLELDGLKPQVAYHRELEKEGKQYETRETTLAAITSSRIVWTRKMDELIDVVNRGDEGQRHLVWLDDLNVAQSTSPRNQTHGSLRASGHSGSEKFAQVANFLDDLEGSPFVEDFYEPAPPEGTQTIVDETLVPPVVWAFPLSLNLKSPEERETARKAAEQAATAPAGGAGAKGTAPAAPAAPAETEPRGAKPQQTNAPEAKPQQTNAPEAKPQQTKAPEAKPQQTKAPETKAEAKPLETKPPETKPEAKPQEAAR